MTELRAAGKPLSAYDILEQLRHLGLKAPPQIYRALTALIEHGLVHKVESLNAFIACTAGHDEPHEHDDLIFLICRRCKSVTEAPSQTLKKNWHGLARKHSFHPEQVRVEIHGVCANCAECGPRQGEHHGNLRRA